VARPGSEANLKLVRGGYGGLRGWIEQVEKMGELKRVSGASWDTEMGAVTHMLTEHSHGTAPALLFDDVPGFPKGFRTLYGHFSSIKRVALTLGLPLERERKVDIVKQYYDRIQTMKHIPPRVVKDGPILENVITGDAIDILKFPVPRHHEADKARYIGTANCVITGGTKAGSNLFHSFGDFSVGKWRPEAEGCTGSAGLRREADVLRGLRCRGPGTSAVERIRL